MSSRFCKMNLLPRFSGALKLDARWYENVRVFEHQL